MEAQKFDIIETYLRDKADKINSENRKWSKISNSRPCEVCKSTEFVSLFRKTVGEFKGSASFGLFGGRSSFRGGIDTDKVLSCRKCHNEKLTSEPTYIWYKELFWDEVRHFYFNVDSGRGDEIPAIYLNYPVETRRFAMNNENYKREWYNEIVNWSPGIWANAGFSISKIKKKFLFWRWEKFPTWVELERQVSSREVAAKE